VERHNEIYVNIEVVRVNYDFNLQLILITQLNFVELIIDLTTSFLKD